MPQQTLSFSFSSGERQIRGRVISRYKVTQMQKYELKSLFRYLERERMSLLGVEPFTLHIHGKEDTDFVLNLTYKRVKFVFNFCCFPKNGLNKIAKIREAIGCFFYIIKAIKQAEIDGRFNPKTICDNIQLITMYRLDSISMSTWALEHRLAKKFSRPHYHAILKKNKGERNYLSTNEKDVFAWVAYEYGIWRLYICAKEGTKKSPEIYKLFNKFNEILDSGDLEISSNWGKKTATRNGVRAKVGKIRVTGICMKYLIAY
ncbi:hypothetical protein KAJ89_06135 [Candidatus Parcubacteria bacterium]|nr:hypothetical protein [Candidatus Parcubacteria bacterium]